MEKEEFMQQFHVIKYYIISGTHHDDIVNFASTCKLFYNMIKKSYIIRAPKIRIDKDSWSHICTYLKHNDFVKLSATCRWMRNYISSIYDIHTPPPPGRCLKKICSCPVYATIYARNFNYLSIHSGQAGLRYAN